MTASSAYYSSEVVVTYLNIILYAISYQLQRPVEPFLVRSLIHKTSNKDTTQEEDSQSNQTYGRLTSLFSLIQTIGSPLVGTLLDRIGPRKTSILVYGGSALSYWILCHATTPAILYWSKVPTVLQHAFLVGQATVSRSSPSPSLDDLDSTNDDDDDDDDDDDSSAAVTKRAAALGKMTTAYTIGATIGPALGGILATQHGDLYAGARLAVWGSLISVFLSWWFLKDYNHDSCGEVDERRLEKNKEIQQQQQQQQRPKQMKVKALKQQASFTNSLQNTLRFLHRDPTTLTPLLQIKLLNGISSSAFSTILPLILANENKLHLSPSYVGYLMSASSLVVALFAGVGIGPAMKRLGKGRAENLAVWGVGMRIGCVGLFGVVVSWLIQFGLNNDGAGGMEDGVENATTTTISLKGFLLTTMIAVGISLSSHMHATSLTTLTTGVVPSEERGALLGLEHGLFAMARIVGPPLGTWLLSRDDLLGLDGWLWMFRSNDGGDGSQSRKLGIGGVWNVILVCTILDLILVVWLKKWSTRQYSKKTKHSRGGVYDRVDVDGDDHDHSD